MPVPRKIPDDQDLVQLLRQGYTYQQIAEWCRVNLGTDPVAGAVANYVSRHRERLGVDLRRPRYAELIPWQVEDRHVTSKALKMLRVAARLEAGLPVDQKEEARFRVWQRDLEENGLVVTYLPGSPLGFYYDTRKPGDHELIRPPREERRRALIHH